MSQFRPGEARCAAWHPADRGPGQDARWPMERLIERHRRDAVPLQAVRFFSASRSPSPAAVQGFRATALRRRGRRPSGKLFPPGASEPIVSTPSQS